MTRKSRPPASRLAEGGDAVARLLEQGADAFDDRLDEARAFRRLERAERRRRRTSVVLTCAGLVVAGAFWSSLPRSAAPEARFAVAPEVVAPSAAAVRAPSIASESEPALRETAPLPASSASRPPAPPSSRGELPAPSETRCRELASHGSTARAVDCFRTLARGNGLQAEVALHEAARLSAEKLVEPARALELASEYARRFPNGVLRGEVDWLRVRSLRAVGRSDEALAASEELLASNAGKALARDLHWLRGLVFQDDRRDCERAVSEFVSLVGEPGPRGDEAELRRARCFEALGRVGDARLAYEQYLKRPAPEHAATAERRLVDLTRSAD